MTLMRRPVYQIALCCLVTFLIACGGGGGGTIIVPPNKTTITVNLTIGIPNAVAVQVGDGPFTAATIQNNQVTFDLPSSTTKFAFAFPCTFDGFQHEVFMLEATPADGTSFNAGCTGGLFQDPFPDIPGGNATGTIDASAVPGANAISILGGSPPQGNVLNAASGSFNVQLSAGTDDVAMLAFDASDLPLAVRILRNQSVPGALNGGNTIVLGANDLITMQPLNITNVPAGFAPLQPAVLYVLPSGLNFNVRTSSDITHYPAIPAASTQKGDFYNFGFLLHDTATGHSTIAMNQTTSSGGGPITIALPDPWSYSGPVPVSGFPTLAFNYSGFSGLPVVAQEAGFGWSLGPLPQPVFGISVLATPSYQNGANTITIPNLASVPGFSSFAPPASGLQVGWGATIHGATVPVRLMKSLISLPADNSVATVSNEGTYIQP